MDKPTINYAVAYQRFRSELNEAVIAESVSEEKSYTVSLEEYFKEREQELNDEVEKQKAL